MLGYASLKVVHVLGVLLLFASLGGLAALRGVGGRPYKILHGVALLVVFVAGFGLLAGLGLHSPGSWPAWVWIKLVVWLLLGASLAAIKRADRHAELLLLGLTILGAVAAWAALAKP